MVGDAELRQFRHDYYGVLVALLSREPTARVLESVGRGIDQRAEAAARLAPALGAGWRAIAEFLAATPAPGLAETVAEEYTRLFLGPFAPEVQPYESFYVTGRILDRPLAHLRADLAALGIEREPGAAEPEDFLALELDAMRRLIERQAHAGDAAGEARWLDAQAAFLKRHLLMWGPAVAADLARAPGAAFYRGVARLLDGFLGLEADLFREWGTEPVRTLEDARAGLGVTAEWRGPLFDPGQAGT